LLDIIDADEGDFIRDVDAEFERGEDNLLNFCK